MRSVIAILVACLVSSQTGCSVSHEYRTHATVGGSALAIAGLFVARPKPVDSDMNGRNDYFLNDDFSGFIPGTLMVIGGLALLIAGLNAREPVEEPAIQPQPQPVTILQPTVPVQPPLAPLPETAVTFDVLQLAKQVRSAAAYGLCDAARATLARVAELDAAYAEELRTGPVLAPCKTR
jgi:hypothetical protein